MKSLITAVALAVALSGCYVIPIDAYQPPAALVPPGQPISGVRHARLYPLNETAGKTGALTAVVSDNANGHATFTLNYDGEMLQGEASRLNGQRGIASAAGSRGTYVNCEYALAGANRGTGSCTFSNGAKYQLHFGS